MTSSFNSLYEIHLFRKGKITADEFFQFSLWDSYLFCVMGGRLAEGVFQFSLWDSNNKSNFQSIQNLILSILFMRFFCMVAKFFRILKIIFQFSLWDSKRYYCCKRYWTLSILFMRFYLVAKGVMPWEPFFFQFSLWDSNTKLGEWHSDNNAFNSLYEIQEFIIMSYSSKSFKELSILFMRFKKFCKNEGWWRKCFQFSLWDSLN